MNTSARLLTASFAVALMGACRLAAAEPASGRDIFLTLTKSGDAHVRSSLEGTGRGGGFGGGRGTGAQFMVFAAAYANRDSEFFHDAKLIPAMERFTQSLRETQLPDGLWDSGNLDSPPDSAFTLKTLAKGQYFLERDNHAATAVLRARMKEVILACAEGVRTGGVHTPNHRWAICTALVHVNLVYPNPKLIARVDEWLAEGIDVDEDGQWSERSPNYTSDVNNPGILEVGILLKRPQLLEGVRRNLEMTVYHTEPNGDVEAVASRRQDQRAGSRKHIWEYYVPYRYLAIHDRNGTFAAMAHRIERDFLKEVGAAVTNMSSALTSMLVTPELARDLPAAKPLPETYAQVFPRTAMARVRRGNVSATIYGGSDWFAGLGVGSGIATNPTFFKFRKGAAILESVRMTPSFFSTGFFYSRGLKAEGGKYILSQTLNVPYHLPLPPEHRNPKGDYALSADMATEGVLARFFSKMDFAHRPKQFRTLRSDVTVTEQDGAFTLDFNVDGPPNVAVTIELGFRSGGTFTGVAPIASVGSGGGRGGRGGGGRGGGIAPEADNAHVLKEGTGTYTVGSDKIEFGPGQIARPPGRMEGETYGWIGGNLRAEGDRDRRLGGAGAARAAGDVRSGPAQLRRLQASGEDWRQIIGIEDAIEAANSAGLLWSQTDVPWRGPPPRTRILNGRSAAPLVPPPR